MGIVPQRTTPLTPGSRGEAETATVAATVGGTIVGTAVDATGAIGTTAADEQAANSSKLQLNTTIRLNIISSPGRHPKAAFAICVKHASL
jgi:hypothetical protein